MVILQTGRIIDHVLLFSPLKLNLRTVLLMARSVWPYGNVQQDKEGVSMGAVNYCAKHQVKSCKGSNYQNFHSPIFRILSNYNGGLGCDMVNEENYNRWLSFDPVSEEYNKRFLEVVQGSIKYKVSFPRVYHRKFWKRFCEEHKREILLSDSELENLIVKNYKKFVENLNIFINFQPELRYMTLDEQINLYYVYFHQRDFEKRSEYERTRINKKRSELIKKYNLNLKDISYEHF